MEEYWTAMDALQEGEIGVVRRIGLEGTIARRLRELGLIVGTKVRCLQKSPAGNPVAYGIRGAVIALDTDKMRTISEMRRDLSVILARGVCKNVSREEVHNLVDSIYDAFTAE